MVHAVGLQIWDFHLGRLRVHEEPEVAYGASDAGFMIKNFGELMKEGYLTNTKTLTDIYQINCPIAHDDISINVSPACTSFIYPLVYYSVIYIITCMELSSCHIITDITFYKIVFFLF